MNHSRQKFFSRLSLFTALVFCGCTVLTLSSCSKKPSAAIIGKWRVQGSNETVEFRKDGTVITAHKVNAGPPGNPHPLTEETTGKYAFTDANHMSVQINQGNTNQPPISATCVVHIHGDKMDMTVTVNAPGNNGQQEEKASFRRLK